MRCWNWCEGWAPERWPLYAAFHTPRDWGATVELMLAMRDEVHRCQRAAAERPA